MTVSVILSVYNEEESIPELYKELAHVIHRERWDAEIIMVDDGSVDQSVSLISKIAEKDAPVRLVQFARNFGQTAAILAGIDHASGEIVVPIDADLQNDPADIPRLIARIKQGYDLVEGWGKSRKDRLWSRRLPSFFGE